MLIETHFPGEPCPVGPNFTPYTQEPLVFADLVVEGAECDAVGIAIVATARPILQVMDLEIVSLRAFRGGAVPTIAVEDAALRSRKRLVMIRPHLARAMEDATQGQPSRDPSRRRNVCSGSHAILLARQLNQEIIPGLEAEAEARGTSGRIGPGQERLV